MTKQDALKAARKILFVAHQPERNRWTLYLKQNDGGFEIDSFDKSEHADAEAAANGQRERVAETLADWVLTLVK